MLDTLKSYWSMTNEELEKEAIKLARNFIDEVQDELDNLGYGGEFDVVKPLEMLTKTMFAIDGDISDLEYQFYQNISTKLGFDAASYGDLSQFYHLTEEDRSTVLKHVSTLASFVKNSAEYIVKYLFIIGIYDGEYTKIEKLVCNYYMITLDEKVDLEQFVGKDRIVDNPSFVERIYEDDNVSVTLSMSMNISIDDDDDDDDDY